MNIAEVNYGNKFDIQLAKINGELVLLLDGHEEDMNRKPDVT